MCPVLTTFSVTDPFPMQVTVSLDWDELARHFRYFSCLLDELRQEYVDGLPEKYTLEVSLTLRQVQAWLTLVQSNFDMYVLRETDLMDVETALSYFLAPIDTPLCQQWVFRARQVGLGATLNPQIDTAHELCQQIRHYLPRSLCVKDESGESRYGSMKLNTGNIPEWCLHAKQYAEHEDYRLWFVTNQLIFQPRTIHRDLERYCHSLIGPDFPFATTRTCIAGGSLVHMLRQLPPTTPRSDIDVWMMTGTCHEFTHDSWPEVRQRLSLIMMYLAQRHGNKAIRVYGHGCTWLIGVESIPMTLNVILTDCQFPHQVVSRFDMPHVQMFYNGSQLSCSPSCVHAWFTNFTALSNPAASSCPAIRLYKAVQQQFTVSQEDQVFIQSETSQEQIQRYCQSDPVTHYEKSFLLQDFLSQLHHHPESLDLTLFLKQSNYHISYKYDFPYTPLPFDSTGPPQILLHQGKESIQLLRPGSVESGRTRGMWQYYIAPRVMLQHFEAEVVAEFFGANQIRLRGKHALVRDVYFEAAKEAMTYWNRAGDFERWKASTTYAPDWFIRIKPSTSVVHTVTGQLVSWERLIKSRTFKIVRAVVCSKTSELRHHIFQSWVFQYAEVSHVEENEAVTNETLTN